MGKNERHLSELFSAANNRRLEVIHGHLGPRARQIVNLFYSELLGNPEAAVFLDHEMVSQRLIASQTAWLDDLFRPRHSHDFTDFIARQRRIGQVHAQINLPMELQVEGMRVMRREIGRELAAAAADKSQLMDYLLLVNELLDAVVSLMNETYIEDLVAHDRNTQSLRMHTSGYNLALECEQQRAALYDWLAGAVGILGLEAELNGNDLPTLGRSDFNLWLNHKAALTFGESIDIERLKEAVERIDGILHLAAGERRNGLHRGYRQRLAELEEAVHGAGVVLSLMSEHMVHHEGARDPLTRVFNRRYLPTVFRHENEVCLKYHATSSVVVTDIDHFKEVNDTHGHDAGDRILVEFAELLLGGVRAGDYVFRFGGEEFLLLLAGANAEQAADLAERLRIQVAEHRFTTRDDVTVPLTASFGVARHLCGPDYMESVKRADVALYEAKEQGRNRCIMAPEP
ncbi:MAG: GGDEF domain-containing protein [Gammaproteobacteria bacterium]|nr:GGDEF domain-containing protein [Gammaproteobacteria bacterium]